MAHVFVISDSNDSSEENFGAETNAHLQSKKSSEDSDNSIDLNFPSIHVSYANDLSFSTKDLTQQVFAEEILNTSPVYELSSDCENDRSGTGTSQEQSEELQIPGTSHGSNLKSNFFRRSSAHSVSESSDSEGQIADDQRLKNLLENAAASKKPKKVKGSTKKNVGNKDKEKLREERLQKKENLAKEKASKAIASKKVKNNKPGECLKFMEVIFDEKIQQSVYYPEIIATLESNSIKHSIAFYSLPNTITWKRNTEDYYLNEKNDICTNIIPEVEKQMIIIWNWEDVINFIADDTFSKCISNIKASVPNYNLTLVVYNIEEYFEYHNKGSSRSRGNKGQKNTNGRSNFQRLPKISREKFEMCLTEIQMFSKCTSRLIETPQDLALMVYQYTKSIAEIPYKMEKHNTIATNYNWYVYGDKKETVNVAKSGHGLKRLWQQQLCQFNLMSLEIAEAICFKYPSPISLIEAYMNCTPQEGANLLKDIPIRRAAGPLTTMRKIGPELSRKIYTMFTAENPKTLLD